jgi:hypothetical protein
MKPGAETAAQTALSAAGVRLFAKDLAAFQVALQIFAV